MAAETDSVCEVFIITIFLIVMILAEPLRMGTMLLCFPQGNTKTTLFTVLFREFQPAILMTLACCVELVREIMAGNQDHVQ